MLKYFVPLAAFLILVVLLAVGLKLDPREVPSPFIGKPAPSFSAERLNDKGQLGPADLNGEIWLFNIWASWCGGCQTEHPLLTKLIKDEAITAIGLNYKDENPAARRWLARFGNPFTAVVTDPEGKIGLDWGVYGVPETFIVDHKGVIRHKHIGPLTRSAVAEEIKPLLAELRKEAAATQDKAQ